MRKKSFTAMLAIASTVLLATTSLAADAVKSNKRWVERQVKVEGVRPLGKKGLNTFETPKSENVPYTGFQLDWGAAFSADLQGLGHKNSADSVVLTKGGPNVNKLGKMGWGFNTPNANLYLHSQLWDGGSLHLTMFLSSRHHNETWVKDGYLLIKKLPFESKWGDALMSTTTLKLGHMEVNYGDTHFRRSDNALSIMNPFVENLVLDSYTTEIGGEVYEQLGPYTAMLGVTGGEIKGNLRDPGNRTPSIIAKAVYDKQVNKDLRVRVSASHYRNERSAANTLYSGDRAGSRYWLVMENAAASNNPQLTGRWDPKFSSNVAAYMLNNFIKYKGVEVFGTLEFVAGSNSLSVSPLNRDKSDRSLRQYALEGVYRFMDDERAYVGARWNRVSGQLMPGSKDDGIAINRYSVAAGYYLTDNVLAKLEYVYQTYDGFPKNDIKHGGSFSGPVAEVAIGF